MDFDFKSCCFGSPDQFFCLFNRENSLLTEDIKELGQIFFFNFGKDFLDEKVDVIVFSRPVFFWDFMGAHKSRDDIDGMYSVQLFERFKLLYFVFKVQAVAALGFGSRSSQKKHTIEAIKRKGEEFLLGSLTGCFYCCLNS